jgi:hypothetical protein
MRAAPDARPLVTHEPDGYKWVRRVMVMGGLVCQRQ